MSETITETSERQPRYSVCDSGAVEVYIERARGCRPPAAGAELLDLSLTGARICVPIAIRTDEALHLRLKHHASKLDEAVSARVRWVRPGKRRTWLAGCSFLSELSAETIDALAVLGCLDQDRFERSPICGEATAWQQLNPAGVTVRLVDLSRGGLSLLSSQAAKVGQRLRLEPHADDRRHDMVVQVRCCAALANGFLLSCRFEHPGDYRLLRGTVRSKKKPQQRSRLVKSVLHRSQLISRTTILLLGGMFVGLAVGLTQPRYAIIGVLSMVAYVGLEFADENRKRLRQSRWSEFFEELLEQRLAEQHENLQSGWTARPISPANGSGNGLAIRNAQN